MKTALQFLAKFILASVVVFIFWAPFSRTYFSFLGLETDFLFWVMDHPARLEFVDGKSHIHYLGLSGPHQSGQDVRVTIYQRIAINLNLIILIALFFAIPKVSLLAKVKGVLWGIFVLSISHSAHIYFLTHLFIWEYIAQQSVLPNMPNAEINTLILAVEQEFSSWSYYYIKKAELYWNAFMREMAPLVIVMVFLAYHNQKDKTSLDLLT